MVVAVDFFAVLGAEHNLEAPHALAVTARGAIVGGAELGRVAVANVSVLSDE